MADPYTTATSFTNLVGYPQLVNQSITTEEMRRVNRELEHWKIYKGQHWKTQRPPGEPQVTANYSKAFVDKGVAFLMGKGFNIKTKSEAMNITKPVLDDVWDDNTRELLALDMAQSGGITGNAWIKVAIEEFDREIDPIQAEEYPNGRIRLIVLPSFSVFPTWDGHDKEKMVRCKIMYPIYIENEKPDGSIDREQHWYREVITRGLIREYVDDRLIDERENSLGEIPVVRVRNLPVSGEPLGMSDLDDVIPLQHELNAKVTDISDIINYHAAPITLVFGAKVKNLEKGARKIWGGLPKDGDVKNLELDSELEASLNYVNLVKTAMFELAKMPEDAFGRNMNVSNTSGVALHIRNQPLMELTRTKWITYGEGIQKINRLILLSAMVIEHPSLDIKAFKKLSGVEKYWTETEFPNPLPKDELIEMQLIAQKIKLMLKSRKEALVELGATEPDKDLDEILEEVVRIETLLEGGSEERAEEAQNTNLGGIVHQEEQAQE